MECKDKFLLQSVIVPPQTEIDELSQDTVRIFSCESISLGLRHFGIIESKRKGQQKSFSSANDGWCCSQFNRESGKTIEERKLRVVYISPQAALGNVEDEALMGFKQSPEYSSVSSVTFLSLC